MIPAIIPIDEARRLFALRRLQILDTKAEPGFDHITALARQIFNVPIALISFVDKDRQWFKSKNGTDVTETPRDISFCGYTILDDHLFIVNDAKQDIRFCDNPVVANAPGIQAYGGAPLHAPTGERIGTLCILDTRERSFSETELEPLRALAGIIEDMLCRTDDLLRSAYYDALTNLPNRLLLQEKINLAMTHATDFNHSVAIIAVNVDQFKAINQSLGHEIGDILLKNVARRISECVGSKGIVGRVGADEFCIVQAQQNDPVFASNLAAIILQRLAEPFVINEQEVSTTASIGIGVFPKDSQSVNGLFACADIALTRAKDSGRNTTCYYVEEGRAEPHARFQLYADLRQALKRAELELYYQPEIDLVSGDIVGVEALLRWNHPRLGLLGPADFIEIAEDSGLIIPIGEWVLQEACREAQKWRARGLSSCSVAVNLSALQFKRDNLESSVLKALQQAALPSHCLELELTESILIHDNENTLECIRRLKALGIRLAIDDFGTGYSNLAYLRRFSFDKLKIDQSFVRRLAQSAEDLAIVKAIIQLAESLKLKTIAEGVETREQMDQLRALGCASAQGYLFSRPMPAVALQNLLGSKLRLDGSDVSHQPDCA